MHKKPVPTGERTNGAQRRQLIIPRQLLGVVGTQLASNWQGDGMVVLCELLDWGMLSQIWRVRLLELQIQCLKPQGSSVHELLGDEEFGCAPDIMVQSITDSE